MAKNFAQLAFGETAKKIQEQNGSRASYARMESMLDIRGLDTHAQAFIRSRDSFYMASVLENGFPYIQHRWGPKGFVKILDKDTIWFIDMSGNRQYVSVGNIVNRPEVSLFFMDYSAQVRLKVLARAEIVELGTDDELYQKLDLHDYDFRPERMIVLHIEAYDWNCPQHITPRYTEEEIEHVLSHERERIAQLEAENKELRNMLQQSKK